MLRAVADGELVEAWAPDGAAVDAGSAPAGAFALATVMLARCTDEAVLLKYSAWLLTAAPQQLLTALCTRPRGAPLPIEAMLALLRQGGGDLLVPYLQHMVDAEGVCDVNVHSELALAYFTAAEAETDGTKKIVLERAIDPGCSEGTACSRGSHLVDVIMRLLGGASCKPARARMLIFLCQSEHYNAVAVLSWLQTSRAGPAQWLPEQACPPH